MIAVYAMGGGLGHLARARRVLEALGRVRGNPREDALILSASPFARGPDIVAVPRRLARSRTEFGAWLKETLRRLSPSAVVVDAFPLGILGELADPDVLPAVPLYHVARLLKWQAYRKTFPGTPRSFDTSFLVEELEPAHANFIHAHSRSVKFMELEIQSRSAQKNPFRRPTWLIVHSGPVAEIHALIDFSLKQKKRADLVVVSPRALNLPEGVTQVAHERAWELFPHAERIVTGCGFNSMLEAAPWRAKHLFMPFERRFDDQRLRAQRAGQC